MNKKIYSIHHFLLGSFFILLSHFPSICQTVQITGNPSSSVLLVVGNSIYHVSENIYTETEIGANTFTTAATAINHIDFNVFSTGTPTAINNFRLYLKEVPSGITSFTTGVYSTAGYTLVFNGTLNAPATGWTGVDFTTTFTRTAGNNLQLLIERLDNLNHGSYSFYAAKGISTDQNVQSCRRYNNNTLPASGITSLTMSNFRPQIQLRHRSANDAAVTAVYTLGKLPIPYAAPHAVSANIINNGLNTLFNLNVTLNISGANTFTDVQNIASVAPGASAKVTFAGFTPAASGFNTISVSLPNDDFNTDNTSSVSQEVTTNSYNYAYGTSATGAAGLTNNTIDMAVKFTTNTPTTVNQIGVNFGVGGLPFKMGIWDKSGAGVPGSLLWESDTMMSTQGVFTLPVIPNVAVTDTFYVGVRQTSNTNIQFSYQSETPVRLNTFFLAFPSGSTAWSDFAPNNPFRFMIEPRLSIANDVGISQINDPVSTTSTDNCGIIPQARVTNFGSSNQTSPFNVTFLIKQSGNTVYTDTKPISLLSGESQNLYFNPVTGSVSGADSSFAFTSLAIDGARNNDTVVNKFTTSNYSYAVASVPSGNYAFANSTVCASPSAFQPTYNWLTETTNEINWGSNGDDSVLATPVALPFTFKYFGIDYTQFWICSNGWISFTDPTLLSAAVTATPASIPLAGGIQNYIAGALTDLDVTTSTYADAHTYYGGNSTQFVITFNHAHLFGSANDFITFQIILKSDGNIFVQYNDAKTASPLPTNLLNNCTVGIENSTGTQGVLYRRNGNGGSMFGSPLALQYRPETTTPVTLLNFTVQRVKKINKISWSTSQEINSKIFIIERSNNGRNFSAIGQIAATGNSYTTINYSFTDNAPAKGINYYRLKQVDIDNTAKYSAIRNVRNEGTADIAVYPNPVKDIIKIDISSDKADKVSISITDMSGKLVYSKSSIDITEGMNNPGINASSLKAGTYIIKIQLSDDVVVKKFNKF